jgi:hypothetical protein
MSGLPRLASWPQQSWHPKVGLKFCVAVKLKGHAGQRPAIQPTGQSALRLGQAFLGQGFQFRSDLFQGGGKADLFSQAESDGVWILVPRIATLADVGP